MKKLLGLIIFGIAFGFLEAAVVSYLRNTLGDGAGFNPQGVGVLLNLGVVAFVSPASALIGNSLLLDTERLREASTIIILLSVSFLAGKNLRQRIGAFLITFSLWDLFYYVFLKFLISWPSSLFDIDIYFLLPYVWVGPVITALVASVALFIIGLRLFV